MSLFLHIFSDLLAACCQGRSVEVKVEKKNCLWKSLLSLAHLLLAPRIASAGCCAVFAEIILVGSCNSKEPLLKKLFCDRQPHIVVLLVWQCKDQEVDLIFDVSGNLNNNNLNFSEPSNLQKLARFDASRKNRGYWRNTKETDIFFRVLSWKYIFKNDSPHLS